MVASLAAAALLLASSALASPVAADLGFVALSPRQLVANASTTLNSTAIAQACSVDQSVAPGNLTLCGNATLFNVFRSKARFIAPEGWMNDPMAVYVREDGNIHVGYQHHPQHIQWGNISMSAAISPDFATWKDLGTLEAPLTLFPSMIYDIRGVFDGSMIPAAQGFEGYPTMIYTSTHTGPLGATSDEAEGTETQSIAYTKDGGASWIKLRYGAGGNPVIYNWPMGNLTGFRDPYAFNSPHMASVLDAGTNKSSSDLFLTISGGVHGVGAKLFLYRQAAVGNVVDWKYLGPLVETANKTSYSKWSGNFGTNFETASVVRLNGTGRADDVGTDAGAVDIVGFGTEQGRFDAQGLASHENHWPLWMAANYTKTANGSLSAKFLYAGVIDWGRAYAYVSFPYTGGRVVSVGWTYEDDKDLVLAKQQGYQGALTSFRDLYIKRTYNVDPKIPGLNEPSSWGVKVEADGSTTVSTLGQVIVPEVIAAYKAGSVLSYPVNATVVPGYTPFAQQPTGRYYGIKGQFDFSLNSTTQVGFRVLASESEYTDILYDPVGETLNVTRTRSSLIKSYGNETESANLKLFNYAGSNKKMLSLTLIVDNSVLEVLANDEAVITTRVYPWLKSSVGAGVLSVAGTGTPVVAYNQELWDGLINAFPERKTNSSRGLIWDGPIASLYGLWAGF